MILTYKYLLKDKRAAKRLREQAVAVNQVWNYCNAFQKDIEDRYCAGAPKRPWPTHFRFTTLTKGVGIELGIHQQSVQEVCRTFVDARNAAKKSVRFRSSFGSRRSFGWVPFQAQSRQISGNSITYLGKTIRWFGNKRRPLPDTAKGGAFVEDALGRWWVCFYVEATEKLNASTSVIGVDLGLKSFATMSDGTRVEPLKAYRALEGKLGKAQRARNKNRARRIHAKIENSRKDFLHKLSTKLAGQNALIAVGDVSSKQLAKTRMAKSVLDAGWSAFRTMLKYKAKCYVEVDERFTTQTCSSCGALPPERPRGIAGLGIREWQCSSCGEIHDRDVNAAKNILAIARRSATPLAEESRKVTRISTRGHLPSARMGALRRD